MGGIRLRERAVIVVPEFSYSLDLSRQLLLVRALTREQRRNTCPRGYKMSSNAKKRSKKGKQKGKQKDEPVPTQELEEQKEMEDELSGAALWYSVTVGVD